MSVSDESRSLPGAGPRQDADGTFTIRPSRLVYKALADSDGGVGPRIARRLPAALPALALVVAVLTYRILTVPRSAVLIGVGGAALIILLILGGSGALLELTFRSTALNTSTERVTYRNLLGVVRTFRRDQIRDVFTCSVESHQGRFYPLALFVGHDGKVLFRIWTDFWDGLEVHAALVPLEVEITGRGRYMTSWQLRKFVRRALPLWWWAILWNPFVAVAGLVPLLLIPVVVGITLYGR